MAECKRGRSSLAPAGSTQQKLLGTVLWSFQIASSVVSVCATIGALLAGIPAGLDCATWLESAALLVVTTEQVLVVSVE